MTPILYRFPKLVEEDPRAAMLHRALGARTRPLRADSEVVVLEAALDAGLAAVLKSAHAAGRVVRGLETAEGVLGAEARGMELADRASGEERGVRVSRLLLVANDGGESFYKRVERLVARYGRRVLALRLDADAAALGEPLFGPGRTTRALMVAHKDAVASVLLAVAEQLESP